MRQLAEREPIEPRMLNTGVDVELNTICMKCLEKRPSRRYATAQELAEDLHRFLTGVSIQAKPVSTFFRAKRWCERKPAIALMLGGICLLATGLLSSLGYNTFTFSQLTTKLKSQNVELANTIERLDHSLQLANEQTLRAEANGLRAKQLLFSFDIQRAADAFKQNDLRSAALLLNRQDTRESDRDFCWHYLNARVSGQGQLLACVDQQIWNLTLASDGTTLAAGDAAGRVHLFDVSNGCIPIRSWDTGQKEVNSLSFTPNNEMLATAGDDGRVGIWNVANGDPIRWFDATDTKPVYGVEFFDSGRKLVACGKSPTLFVWNVQDGVLIQSLSTKHLKGIEALSVSPDGTRVATAGYEGFTRVYQFGESSPLIEMESPNDRINTVRFSPDGRWLITGSREKWLRLWNAESGKLLREFEASDHFGSIAFGTAGQIVACESGGVIRLLESGTPTSYLSTSESSDGFTTNWQPTGTWATVDRRHNGLVFAIDGNSFFTGNSSGQIHRWLSRHQFDDGHLPPSGIPEWIQLFNGICVDEKAQHCYRAGQWGLECWDLKTNKRIASPINDRRLHSCTLDFNGKTIVVGDSDGNVAIIPAIAQKRSMDPMVPVWSPILEGTNIVRLETSVDGRFLFVLGQNSELAIVERKTGRIVRRLSNRSALALSPDGRWLVKGRHSTDDLEIADAQTFETVSNLGPKQSTIYVIEFSRDGSKLLTTSGDRTARLWDVKNWTPVHTMLGHAESVFAGAISPDGRTIATGDKAGVICFWNASVGQKLMEVSLQQGEVVSLYFTVDGKSLVASNERKDIYVFKTELRSKTHPRTILLSTLVDRQRHFSRRKVG